MIEDEKNWTRLTLRLPAQLHQRLLDNADGRSLNTTIVKMLEDALKAPDQGQMSYEDMRKAIMAEVEDRMEERFAEWIEQMQIDDAANDQLDDPDRHGKE